MEFKSEAFLRPGDSAERPIILTIRKPQPDEDGERVSVEIELSLHDAFALATDLQIAHAWVKTGAWKPGVK